jgi:signal transduction histidine kinase
MVRRVISKVGRVGIWFVPPVTAVWVLVISAYAVRVLEARLMKERHDTMRWAVETAFGTLSGYRELEARGEKTREEAQRRAIESIRSLRYGNANYFFIQDTGGRLVMHPFRPDLEGKVNRDVLPTGRVLQQEFSDAVKDPGRAGYVTYAWPRPGKTVAVRKLSFVKLYEPWGWIVGSGTYLDDMEATLKSDALRVYTLGSILASILVVGGLAVARSHWRAKRLEIELQHARKLEAVGQLAAGIAHEINTPIQFIGDNTSFLEEAFTDYSRALGEYREAARPERREELAQLEQELDLAYLDEQVPKTFERTLHGVQRVATIVRAMKEFAHPDLTGMVATDLNRSLQATLEVARNEYKYVADVETEYGDIPAVTCYPSEINQVFLNIIVNAAHAIADVVQATGARGTIRVSTRPDDSHVVVSISDTGAGIPETIRDKIFEPFFTTKEVGRGTGQGLAIARNIVRKHQGSIAFETRPGKGTTFSVRLPREASSRPVGSRPIGARAT